MSRWECIDSCHETRYMGDVESLKEHFQHMDGQNFTEDKILNNLKEVTIEVIIGALHCEMMVVSSFQYIVSPHQPNVYMQADSFYEYT